MTAYYNDNDKAMCTWLRNLIHRGLIAPGDVDDRPIQEIQPNDLKDYTQHHFFAGIGGWSLALRYAGWPDDRPVWTGSCPCQPYSQAGRKKGNADTRNLWPDFYRLIRKSKPDVCFGEQVASAIGHGWLDGISTDLEAEGYACGSVVLGAHSVGAPHLRQRIFWVAENSARQRRRGRSDGDTTRHDRPLQTSGLGDDGLRHFGRYRPVDCKDGKVRRIPDESYFLEMADGLSSRVVRLRGYGNAIIPQVASEFIKAYVGVRD